MLTCMLACWPLQHHTKRVVMPQPHLGFRDSGLVRSIQCINIRASLSLKAAVAHGSGDRTAVTLERLGGLPQGFAGSDKAASLAFDFSSSTSSSTPFSPVLSEDPIFLLYLAALSPSELPTQEIPSGHHDTKLPIRQ